jgi:hypothetical protein
MERVTLPEGYKPSNNEEYMNPIQLEYLVSRENYCLRC